MYIEGALISKSRNIALILTTHHFLIAFLAVFKIKSLCCHLRFVSAVVQVPNLGDVEHFDVVLGASLLDVVDGLTCTSDTFLKMLKTKLDCLFCYTRVS